MKYLVCIILIGLATAAQASAPRVLLITGNGNGEAHNPAYPPWIHEFHNDRIVEILDGIAEITVSEDLSLLNDRELSRYRLIINNSLLLTPTKQQLDAFYRFVSEGNAYLAIHSGLASFLNSDRYRQMMGGRFVGGDHLDEINIDTFDAWYGYDYNDQVQHPIVRGLANFSTRDELYMFQTNTEDLEVIARAEQHPVLWQRDWGKGKVMGLTLGHDDEAKANPGYRTLLQNSVRWLLDYPILGQISDGIFASDTGEPVHYIDLDDVAHHPRGSILSYRIAANSDAGLVSASIDGRNRIRLEFTPGATGSAAIRVSAEGPGGLADTSEFNVSVREKGSGDLARYHGVTVHTSSNENRKFTADPNYVRDGDPGSRWSSDYRDPGWITLDLGEPYRINRVKLFWEAAYGCDYEVQVSMDGENWNTVYQRHDGKGGTETIHFDPVAARFVRLFGKQRATRWGYSLYQFEVYGGKAGALQAKREP